MQHARERDREALSVRKHLVYVEAGTCTRVALAATVRACRAAQDASNWQRPACHASPRHVTAPCTTATYCNVLDGSAQTVATCCLTLCAPRSSTYLQALSDKKVQKKAAAADDDEDDSDDSKAKKPLKVKSLDDAGPLQRPPHLG